MASEFSTDLLRSLKKVSWDVAFKTFGSNHATLIGLLVQWWVKSKSQRFALDEGCSCQGAKGCRCDAVLFEGDAHKGIAKGFIEVEGGRHKQTISKMRRFFRAKQWPKLKFGIFLAYPTYASGRGLQRSYAEYFPEGDFIREGKKITKGLPDRELVILVFKKSYGRFKKENLRAGEFYRGTPIEVYGVLIKNGKVIKRIVLKSEKRPISF